MNEKEHLKRTYKSFIEFLSVASSKELEYFILDSKFTSAFNYRMKKLIEEVKEKEKKDIGFSLFFNTKEEIVLIDASLLGNFIANNYSELIERYYKGISTNNIIKKVVNGNDKIQRDFVMISYFILYRTLHEVYKDIKYKKEIFDDYIKKYNTRNYKDKDLGLVVAVIIIIEDVCKYISIDDNVLKDSINLIISSQKTS